MSNVFVLALEGCPLMPCKPSKARKLLLSNRAKVVKMYPFTIQLNFTCQNQVQNTVLGVDSGYKNIGFSVVTDKEELVCGTLVLDGRTSERLSEKRMYRRGRRNKLRYRKARFLNRISTKREGWLPPSTQRRYDTHIRLIEKLKKILPISEIIIETANFDIQKIENPNITGTQYQQGDLYEYQNLRSFLMSREKGLCQLCQKEFSKENSSHMHHIKPKSKGGTDRPKNLALLHKKCHIKLHEEKLFNLLKKPKEFKASTFMSIITKRFYKDIKNLNTTFGYKTFIKRNELNLEKTHYNDAFVIANGNTQTRSNPIQIIQKHRNNRAIQLNRKGYKPSIRKTRYKIQPFDYIWVLGKKYISKGVFNYGKYILYGNIKNKEYFKIKSIEKYYNFGSLIWHG